MNRNLKSISALILAALMLTSSLPINAAKSYASQIESTADKIAASKSEINALNAQLKEKNEERKKNQAALEALEKETELTLEKKYLLDNEMIYLLAQIDLTNGIIEEYNSSIAIKKAEIAETEKKIEEQKTLFTDHFRSNYEQGSSKMKYLELLFNSTSIGDFLTSMHYVASMMDYEQYLIKNMEKLIIKLDSQTADLNVDLEAQTAYKKELEDDKAEVELLDAETESYMAKLMADEKLYIQFQEELDDESEMIANEIQEKADAYDALVKTKEELEALEKARIEAEKKAEEERKKAEEAAKREEEANKNNNKPTNNNSSKPNVSVSGAGIAFDDNSVGRWQWPVNYKKFRYTSPFGTRVDPVTGEKDTWHNGVDFAIAKGNNIYAVDAGVVITSTYHRSYGNYVVVLHDNGMKTLYAHASKLLVSVGDSVARGTVVALVGSTGKSTGNHLHFTVYNKRGEAVNPFNYYPTLSKGLKLYD